MHGNYTTYMLTLAHVRDGVVITINIRYSYLFYVIMRKLLPAVMYIMYSYLDLMLSTAVEAGSLNHYINIYIYISKQLIKIIIKCYCYAVFINT